MTVPPEGTGAPAGKTRMAGAVTPDAWDAVASSVERKGHYLDRFLGELKRDAYLALVDRWRPPVPPRRMLKTDLFEEAVGPDALIPGLTSRFGRWVGMDVSLSAARLAARRMAPQGLLPVVADSRALPFAPGSFDLVVSPSTLDHFPDQADLGRSLAQLAPVLTANARLVITLDNSTNLGDPLLRVAKRLGLIPFYLGRSYSAAGLRRELGSAGFTVHETDAIVHNPRLFAVLCVALARRLHWKALSRLVERILRGLQRFGTTRFRYLTGCFVAALASPTEGTGPSGTVVSAR